MAREEYDTPGEWGDLYTKAVYPLACLRRAKEVAPFRGWPEDALEQRNLLAEAAHRLLACVAAAAGAKTNLQPEGAEKAFADFTGAMNRLREIANARSGEPTLPLSDPGPAQASTRREGDRGVADAQKQLPHGGPAL